MRISGTTRRLLPRPIRRVASRSMAARAALGMVAQEGVAVRAVTSVA